MAKILIDARMYGAKATTGIGQYIHRLLEHSGSKTNHTFTILLREPVFSSYQPSAGYTKMLAEVSWYSLQEQLKLPSLIKAASPDVVHIPHFNVALGIRKNFVVTIHDLTPIFYPGPVVKARPLRRLAYKAVLRHAIVHASRIITISNHTKNQIIKRYPQVANRIRVTYLGVDERFSPASQEVIEALRKQLGITKPYILYVGVWRDHKNIETLVRAFDRVREQGIDCQLVLGGQPDDRYPSIIEAVKQAQYASDIITPGFIADEQLAALYSGAKMFVLPSFCEGFGLVALEAMACGTPVIGSNTTSLPEVCGEAAVYFDPHSVEDLTRQIQVLFTNQKVVAELKAKGFEQVKKYSWERCANETLGVYNEVINS